MGCLKRACIPVMIWGPSTGRRPRMLLEPSWQVLIQAPAHTAMLSMPSDSSGCHLHLGNCMISRTQRRQALKDPIATVPEDVYINIYVSRAFVNNQIRKCLRRVSAIVSLYRAALPKARILLLGLMPRAGRYWEPDQRGVWPNAYTRPLAAVNAGYQACAAHMHMIH